MSLDLTNSNMLDCSPFAENYSNITRATTVIPKTITAIKPKPLVGRPVPKTIALNPTIDKPPVTPVVAPVVAPVVPVVPVAPVSSAPSGGGGGGGGESSGSEAPTEKRADTATATVSTATAGDDKAFYLKMWFWGLLVGGVAGYLYAKNKGKDLKTFAVIGAGIGGLGGLVIEKSINKGVNPKAPNTQVVTTAPSAEQTEQQQ